MTSEEKVYVYLQSYTNQPTNINKNNNNETTFPEPYFHTDTNINIDETYYIQSPKGESSIPYLDISDESPSFKKPLESMTSVKRTLFEEENKINILQNVLLESCKIKKNHLDVSSDSDNSRDADYQPSTSASTDDNTLAVVRQANRKSVSFFCYNIVSSNDTSFYIFFLNTLMYIITDNTSRYPRKCNNHKLHRGPI